MSKTRKSDNGGVEMAEGIRKRRCGIPTGNAGEYFVMGELLRRGFDTQLADRNTKGYDVLVGRAEQPALHKVQVKTVRAQPWYVNLADFKRGQLDRVTVYVLLGPDDGKKGQRNADRQTRGSEVMPDESLASAGLPFSHHSASMTMPE